MYDAELTKGWLLNSGIQNTGKDAGSINAWYDCDKNAYPCIYPETTGYAITSFLFINKQKPEAILLERAKLAAEWLIRRNALHENNNNEKPESHMEYAFDNGMILAGLMNIYDTTKEKRYIKEAEKVAVTLLRLQKPNGEFYAFYNKNTKELVDSEEKWSTQSGSYHAKLSIGLLKIHEATGHEKFRKAAENACDAALKMQQPDGRFVSCKKKGFTHIHPHCYSAEGLLYASNILKKPEYALAARKAAEWALKNLREDGSISCVYNNGGFTDCERSDTLAQILRLAKLLGIKHQKEEQLKERLLAFMEMKGRQNGGFFYCMEGQKMAKHLNSWCSMFAMQALSINEKNKKESLRLLI